jgi:hypothetical protein
LTCRKRLVLGTLIVAIVAIQAEHAWLYYGFRRQWHAARAKSAEVALFRAEEPWGPTEYFTREIAAGRVTHWIVDAALITGTAIGAAIVTHRAFANSRAVSDAA